ncbi:efflux RND transporter periplasmic adaptor subunit [Helicobacter ailurogastricus]|uniref:efflux RND transporter periplasmic adaptor subunit n=1 Tax=Helicobacter ailurogastricus TaxID=1578720 RepID=UPI0022BBBD8E|nr:efflux RND transporter periplasmic adaptor subunit [Helicobacter ailurogastricus]GLH57631.1 Cation efflux system protein CzcA [Helicobacter ailurogastricus]GLH59745.1 Cation efflux system protein CzcA [Helicobacter ailurogastricus]
MKKWMLGLFLGLAHLQAVGSVAVQLKEFAPFRRYYATLQADERKVYSYNLRFDGFVEKLYVNRTYQSVRAGDKLFSIYSPALISVQSELLSSSHFNRQVAQMQEKLRLLGVGAGEINKIMQTKKVQNSVEMLSPFSGVVFAKNVNEGGFIKSGALVFQIIDLKALYVLVRVNQEDLDFVRHLSKAQISVEGVPGVFNLEFSNINPLVGAQDKMLEARFILKNPNQLFFPNMFAKVTIYQPTQKMLILPKEAVLIKNGRAVVFKKDDDSFDITEIKAKRLSDGSYQVLEGLKAGDEVAKNALFILDADAINNGDE